MKTQIKLRMTLRFELRCSWAGDWMEQKRLTLELLQKIEKPNDEKNHLSSLVIASTFFSDKELGDRLKDRELTEAEKDFVNALRLGHIFAFATGSSTIPAMGFNPNPKLSFSHDEAKVHPIAHTCANELQLFVNNRTLANNDEFEYIILAALMNGAVFSTV
ncbi:UNVERIFIED_CONTAM: hypothetical protein FKN15_055062 [Acipenser sinensis]